MTLSLSNFSIGKRLIAGFAISLLTGMLLTMPVIYTQLGNVIEQAERNELRSLMDNVRGRIEAEGRLAQGLSSTMATLPYIKDMFANGERDALYAAVAHTHKYVKANYAVRQFQFHTPPATSFLRVHKPQKFGDDLSSFRHTVVEVNKSQTGIWGIEKGVAGLGIRGVMPVIHNEQHIGSVEFGMSFGQPFFDRIKAAYKDRGMELALHVFRDGKYQPFAKTFEQDMLLDSKLLDQAMDNRPVLSNMLLNGVPKSVYVARINDYAGKAVGVVEIGIDREAYVAAERNVLTSILVVGFIALLIGMLLAIFISRSIAKPLCNAKLAMDDIAEGDGDLTQRLPVVGKDEVAQLADSFNRFAAKVQNMVGQVAGSTTQIATAAEQMSAITAQSDELMQRQKSETDQVVTAINEMAVTIREVAQNAESAAASAVEADEQSRNGQMVVMSTVESINSLATEVEHASGVIQKLEQDSQSIGSVLDVIKDVADQTNLLALNAAIEAARAGEQGRGFAVVADEVRTLASRTQESTEEISKIIQGFQTAAREAVSVMQEGRNKAESSVEQAAEAGNSLNAITEAVTSINDMNQQIATASEEQSVVAEEVNRNIVSINNVAEEATEGSRQSAYSSSELARLASDLQSQVNQFKY